MSGLHVLVDFENVQPTFEEVAKLAPGVSEVWLFHGPHQGKLAEQFKSSHQGVTTVPISRTGKNALDFHLSFYLGYVAARHPTGRLTVIANDKGYDPMIVHPKALGFTTQRIGFKAKKAAAAKKAPAAKDRAGQEETRSKESRAGKENCSRQDCGCQEGGTGEKDRSCQKVADRQGVGPAKGQLKSCHNPVQPHREGVGQDGRQAPREAQVVSAASCIDVGQGHAAIRRAGGGQ